MKRLGGWCLLDCDRSDIVEEMLMIYIDILETAMDLVPPLLRLTAALLRTMTTNTLPLDSDAPE